MKTASASIQSTSDHRAPPVGKRPPGTEPRSESAIRIKDYGGKPEKSVHNKLLPGIIRMLVVGSSGCGKTNLCINLAIDYTKWTKLYIITTSPNQPIYDAVHKLGDNVEFCSPEDITDITIDYFKPRSLIIFDDYMCEKDQNLPKEVFSKGRHKRLNSIYITQKFTETELVVRNNANIIVAFTCDDRSKQDIHSAYLGGKISLADFKNIPLDKRDFLVIQPGKDLMKNFQVGGAIDAHALLSKLPHPKKGWTLPNHKYTGPFNPLSEQLDEFDNPLPGQEPYNQIDETALRHDICYRDVRQEDVALNKRLCDKKMLDELDEIKPKNFREKVDRGFVRGVIGAKHKLGWG